jgi:hypothetical protein
MDTRGVTTVNVTDPAITGNAAEATGALLPLLHRPDPRRRAGGNVLNSLIGYQNRGYALIPLN